MIPVSIANHSSKQQDRWCVVGMDCQTADDMPQHCIVDGQWIATKANRLGEHTQLWHVRVTVPGHGEVVLSDWQPFPGEFPAFELSPWLLDDPEKAQLKFNIRKDGAWFWIQFPFHTAEQTIVSAVCRKYYWRKYAGGFFGECEATVWSAQDVVDVVGACGWSDFHDPRWRCNDVLISFDAGYWDDSREPRSGGEPIAVLFEKANGFQRWDSHRIKLYEGPLPTGPGIPFRGVVMPTRDVSYTGPALTLEDRALRAYDSERQRNCEAAAEGPLTAALRWPDGRWLAFGVVPPIEPRDDLDPQAFRDYLATPNTIWRERAIANKLDHNRPGAQNHQFGPTKGTRALHGDPWEILRLMDSADDYWLRAVHHHHDGDLVTKHRFPEWETWSGRPETRAGAAWVAKSGTPPNGWNSVQGRDVDADDQHRCSNALTALFAMTGDALAGWCLRDLQNVDEMRAYARRKEANGLPKYDAPRSSGRLLEDWAHMVLLVNGPRRTRYMVLAALEADICEQVSASKGSGPVRVLATYRDDRVLENHEAILWWQEGIACMGFLGMGRALQRLGLSAPADRFLDFGRALAVSLIKYGRALDMRTGRKFIIDACKWNAGGQPNLPEYYFVPRPGATSGKDHSGDLHIPDSDWDPWCAAAYALGVGHQDTNAEALQVLAEKSTGGDLNNREWWACR